MNKIGTYLKDTRKRRNLTLRVVEEITGISNAYLSQLENGKIKKPSPSVLYKLANCYNVSYDHLLELAGHPIPKQKEEKKLAPTFRLRSSFGELTKEEEEKLLEYLEFLRSKKRSGK